MQNKVATHLHGLILLHIKVRVESCITELRIWMYEIFLKLNDSKTEFLVIGSQHNLSRIPTPPSIKIGNTEIPAAVSARNIGAIFDSHLLMADHINNLSKSCYVYLRNIGKIWPYHAHCCGRLLVCLSCLHTTSSSGLMEKGTT